MDLLRNTKNPAIDRIMIIILVVMLSVTIMPHRGYALFSNNLKGNLQVTAVSSETDDQKTRSLNQIYSLNWTRNFTPYLLARASLRYHNLGIDQSQSENSWRYEYQPAGELIWQHPYFTLSGAVRRQETTSNNEATDLIRNNTGLTLKTNSYRYPLLEIRYDWNHTYNNNNRNDRDTKEKRLQAGLSYDYRGQNLYYNLIHRYNENLSNRLEMTQTQHLFRWNQTSRFLNNKLRISSGYDFNYRTQKIENFGSENIMETITFTRALYAVDPTPDLGELDSLTALADGNITTPAQPSIDIGESLVDRNVGVDFGFEREVSAIYIYTDRPSGALLDWQIYISDDNLIWNPVASPVMVGFNPSFNRYEIFFPKQTARFIKGVNSGFNDVISVLVTEIQPLIELADVDREKKSQSAHLLDLAANYVFSKSLETSADLTIRKEPSSDFSNSRDEIYYSFTTRHAPGKRATQVVRYQAGYENYGNIGTRNDSRSLSYSLLLSPLPTLSFSFAALTRSDYIEKIKSREINNLFAQANGKVVAGLDFSLEAGYNRNNQFDSRTKFDNWTYRLSADAKMYRSLDAIFNILYQSIKDLSDKDTRIRRQYRADFNYRLTRTILLRGSLTYDDEEELDYLYQEYNISWNLTRRITIGALATINDGDNGLRSERSNVRLNYNIGSGNMLFLSYTRNEYTLADRSRNTSVQIGLKSGF